MRHIQKNIFIYIVYYFIFIVLFVPFTENLRGAAKHPPRQRRPFL